MKKIGLILLVSIGLGAILLYLNDASFSPLNKKEFRKLFDQYNGTAEKACSVDFLGGNQKGELYEAYLYKIDAIPVNPSYPDFNGLWEQKDLEEGTKSSKWLSCPIDSLTRKLYGFTLTAENFDENECLGSFNEECNKPENYYSHVYFSELEQYFMLYCPDLQSLYYVRRKGF